ncbi:multiheme c-type cytochrome [Methylococcus mesophilus]|uniref:multiheme c-type cytochrome n=1 Tax=Methylococcus mesophilus TaxID=2993564 RepID=UPI00224A4F75|nr:cytochrome C [Methylococcus mesophilus]UZR30919.1 cytochrome C [Methylococcus mesophilus]
MTTMKPAPRSNPLRRLLIGALLLALVPEAAPAATKLKIAKAAWSEKAGTLTIAGKAKGGTGAIDVYDVNGRRLGSGQGDSFALTLSRQDLAGVPCAVRVQSGEAEIIRAVKGAPKSCAGVPTCSIVKPAQGKAVQAGAETAFEATATAKDPAAQPFKYEWDFAGGSLGVEASGGSPVAVHKKADALAASVSFVLDNTTHRVRFIATDAKGRRCEDAVEIAVGSPPAGLPSKVSEQPAATFGSELDGMKGDLVVLPFDDWTMQGDTDADFMPNLYSSMSPTIHNLKAVVYKKDRLPVVVTSADAQVEYSAASNPSDPVGVGSINSTSQNWPLGAAIGVFSPMMSATVQKTQIWEKYTGEPDSQKATDYKRHFWAAFTSNYPYSPLKESVNPPPDMGYITKVAKQDELTGSLMPGKSNPYVANEPQTFGAPNGSVNQDESQHKAALLPLSGVDDQGRVNSYPLFRVQAKKDGKVLASTDTVMTAGRDFQCRGCHAKGQIAANPNAPHTQAAYLATPTGQHQKTLIKTLPLEKPEFFEARSDSIYDQEYAAALNYSSLHDFYDGYFFLRFMRYGKKADWYSTTYATDKTQVTGPVQCSGCHQTAMRTGDFNEAWWAGDDFDPTSPAYDPNYTVAMHRFHGELQWNDAKTDIVRDEKGMYARWDWKTKGRNTKTLFPIFDASGKQLPMEESCLKCHSGQREQHYRDRMATAGVTCYDCHGDMLAVGEAFPKNYPSNKDKLGSSDLRDYRVGWFDNPDCGSCHVGNANLGKDGSGDFFSAGVRKQAFDDADLSATTRPVDRNDPDSRRFSAGPLANYQAAFPTSLHLHDHSTGEDIRTTVDTKVDAPVFRFGKDRHGNVACAACHGAAHSVWPNRDPSSNDNVTALQLQGHTGTILECNVCHTADSFAKKEDLDGGQYSGDAQTGILGGPHDMHPVNDPYWWKGAQGDGANSDGSAYGGWHNDYAKLPGMKGEDQCAACHGNDHKGTRLSKTPVDRVFDFRGFDAKKLKKAGFKTKVVKVAAGTPIGCDTCHSLETSFVGSPGH